MQLIYRGYTYTAHPIARPQPLPPRVINWRYRIPGTLYEPAPTVQPARKPHALNWRYQLAAMG